MFDINRVIKELNLPKRDIERLEKELRQEFPNDKMMYELHFIRALKSFK